MAGVHPHSPAEMARKRWTQCPSPLPSGRRLQAGQRRRDAADPVVGDPALNPMVGAPECAHHVLGNPPFVGLRVRRRLHPAQQAADLWLGACRARETTRVIGRNVGQLYVTAARRSAVGAPTSSSLQPSSWSSSPPPSWCSASWLRSSSSVARAARLALRHGRPSPSPRTR